MKVFDLSESPGGLDKLEIRDHWVQYLECLIQ